MTAKDKSARFTTNLDEGMREQTNPEPMQDLMAARERFASALRTATVEATNTGRGDIRRVLISDDERGLWTSMRESQWRTYLCKRHPWTLLH